MLEQTRLCTNDLGDIVVVKAGRDSIEQARIAREAQVLGTLEHPNVVQMLDCTTEELTLAYGGRNDLARVPITTPSELARVSISILSTIADVAGLGWAHRSVEPGHFLVGERGRVSICSWGRARQVDGATDPAVRSDVSAVATMLRLIGLEIDPASRADRRRIDSLTEMFDEIISEAPDPGEAAQRIISLTGRWTTGSRHRRRGGRRSTPVRRTPPTPSRPPDARSMRGELAGQFAILATSAVTLGLLLFLGSPGTSARPLGPSGRATSIVTSGMEVLRWMAITASVYGIVVALIGIAAIITRRDSLARLQQLLAPVVARRVLVGVTGLGILGSLAGSPGAPSGSIAATAASPAPTTTPATTAPRLTIPPTPPVIPATTPPESPAPAQPAAPAQTWVIARGDHLWRIAERTVQTRSGRDGTDAEVDHYWRRLIETNRAVFADPSNPDLVFAGQVFELPTMD